MSNSNYPFSTDAKMNISGILHRGESRSVCVMFEDRGRSVEIRMPEGEILANNGYNDSEIDDILSYLNTNIDDIMSTAKSINPMKAFMK